MAALQDILVPDIGDFKNVEIIEVSVKPGDRINEDDPLITLESDKASMEVPSPKSGTVAEVKVAVGDRVSKGSLILTLEVGEAQVPEQPSPAGLQESDVEPAQPPAPELAPPPPKPSHLPSRRREPTRPSPSGPPRSRHPSRLHQSMKRRSPRRTPARRSAASPANWVSILAGSGARGRKGAS